MLIYLIFCYTFSVLSKKIFYWIQHNEGDTRELSYVALSYVKYIEQTGAQVVIIPWDMKVFIYL